MLRHWWRSRSIILSSRHSPGMTPLLFSFYFFHPSLSPVPSLVALTQNFHLYSVHIHSSSSDWQISLWVSKHLNSFSMYSFVCLSSGDLFIFYVQVSPFYSYFCVIRVIYSFSSWCLCMFNYFKMLWFMCLQGEIRGWQSDKEEAVTKSGTWDRSCYIG